MNIRVVLAPAAALGGEGTFFLFEGAYHGSMADYERFIQPFKDAAIAIGGFAGFFEHARGHLCRVYGLASLREQQCSVEHIPRR